MICYDDREEPKKAKQDKDETGGVDIGLLKENHNARLNSNKQDKKAIRRAMVELLKN